MGMARKSQRVRLVAAAAGIVLVLGGCTSSPEASRVPGEPGGDVGNHGQPVELLEPTDRFERIFWDIPFDEPSVTTEDTAEQ